jgi:4-amino-4-deoxy-L-arabinose transferase-like glycosyltransferase
MQFRKNSLNEQAVFLIILFLLFLYGSVENYIILKADTVPSINDYEFYTSLKYYDLISEGKIFELVRSYLFEYEHIYPPFMVLQPIPFYFFMGASQDTAAFSNILHIFILLFSTYFIGKKIKDSYAGLLSALVLLFMPVFLPISRIHTPDFPLASFYALSLMLLLYSDFYLKRIPSILLGVTLAFGMLSKWTFFIYVMPVFFTLFMRQVINKKFFKDFKIKFRNFIVFLSVFTVFFGHWYLFNAAKIIKTLVGVNGYYKVLNNSQAGLTFFDIINKSFKMSLGVYLYLLAIAIFSFFLKKILSSYLKSKKSRVLDTKNDFEIHLMVWFLLGFIPFVNYFPNPRYLIPFFVLFSLIIGFFLRDLFLVLCFLFKKLLRIFSFSIAKRRLFLFYVLLLFILCFSYYSDVKDVMKKQPVSLVDRNYVSGIYFPIKRDLKIEHIYSIIENMSKDGDKVLIFQYSPVIDSVINRFEYTRTKRLDFINIMACLSENQDIDIYKACELHNMLNSQNKCDYEIVIDTDIFNKDAYNLAFVNFPERIKYSEMLKESWEDCKKYFEIAYIVENVYVTDFQNSTLYFYKKKFK